MESTVKTYLGCVPCFVRQTLEAAQRVTGDPAVHEAALREVLRRVADMDLADPPPAMGQVIHRIVRRITGVDDPYREAKQRFNAFALGLYPELTERIDASADPVAAAVQLAAAGNVVDLGVKSGLDDAQVREAIEGALEDPLDRDDAAAFRRAVEEAQDILYLGDNAGEIVFDRMLIERLPREKITFVVRGRPIINDATMEDAVETGIAALVPVIDNGSDAPGTILSDCSPVFRERFAAAGLIIAKGQGNYETLSAAGRGVFFLLKVKCPVIAEDIGCPVGTLILRRA